MLYDGINMVEESTAVNLTVDSGDKFPTTNPSIGELFYRTTDSTLYVYTDPLWTGLAKIPDVIYDISVSVPSTINEGDTILLVTLARDVILSANPAYYFVSCLTPSASPTVFDIKRNDTLQVGTISFAANSTTPIFDITQTPFAAGDFLTISTQSPTPHSKLSISIRAILD